MNILSDKSELKKLTDGLQLLPLNFTFIKIVTNEVSKSGCKKNADKMRASLPLAQEKIKSRKENRIGLKINLKQIIKTQQGLSRVLLILSIYLSGHSL